MSRPSIPKTVKFKAKKRCGFGCIFCGHAVTHIHHIIPYEECENHNSDNLTLLCPLHHNEVHTNLISRETVAEKNKLPYCKENDGPRYFLFDIGRKQPPIVMLGNMEMINCKTIFNVLGTPMLYISPPEKNSKIWTISGLFHDETSHLICRIFSNEVTFIEKGVDIIQSQNKFIIRRECNGEEIFKLCAVDKNRICLEIIKTNYKGNQINVNNNSLYGYSYHIARPLSLNELNSNKIRTYLSSVKNRNTIAIIPISNEQQGSCLILELNRKTVANMYSYLLPPFKNSKCIDLSQRWHRALSEDLALNNMAEIFQELGLKRETVKEYSLALPIESFLSHTRTVEFITPTGHRWIACKKVLNFDSAFNFLKSGDLRVGN